MSAASGLKALWLAWFSKPAGDRLLYQILRKRKLQKFLLLGLADAQRAMNVLSLAARHCASEQIQLVGIDRFESRPASEPRIALKEAHRLLRATGAKVNLVPGDPLEALSRVSNSIQGVELVLVSADQDQASLEKAWFYLPRMLSPDAILLREEPAAAGIVLKPFTRIELERWASSAATRRRAA